MTDNSIVGGPNWVKFELFLEPRSSSYLCHHDLDSRMNSETHPYIQRHISHINYFYTSNHTLISKGEMPCECGASSLLNGASCLPNRASCLLNVGRLVLGRVFFWVSCLGASCLWDELSVIRFSHPIYLPHC